MNIETLNLVAENMPNGLYYVYTVGSFPAKYFAGIELGGINLTKKEVERIVKNCKRVAEFYSKSYYVYKGVAIPTKVFFKEGRGYQIDHFEIKVNIEYHEAKWEGLDMDMEPDI